MKPEKRIYYYLLSCELEEIVEKELGLEDWSFQAREEAGDLECNTFYNMEGEDVELDDYPWTVDILNYLIHTNKLPKGDYLICQL